MAKIIDKHVTGLEESWENYKGSRIEEYLKNKCGWFNKPNEREDDGKYHLKGFTSEDSFNLWNTYRGKTDGEIIEAGYTREYIDSLVLVDTVLEGSDKVINYTNLQITKYSEVSDANGAINITYKFTSLEYNPVTNKTTDTGELGTLKVEYREDEEWKIADTYPIESVPESSETYKTLNIGNNVPEGSVDLRVTVIGQATSQESKAVILSDIVNSVLKLTNVTDSSIPSKAGTLSLSFNIQGKVNKTVVITATSENYSSNYNYYVSNSEYLNSAKNIVIEDSGLVAGKYAIEAYLLTDSGVKSNVETFTLYTIEYEDQEEDILAVNIVNVSSDITNYSSNDILTYSCYNNKDITTSLKIVTTNSSASITYDTEVKKVENKKEYTYSASLNIDSDLETIPLCVYIYKQDANEDTLLQGPIRITANNKNITKPVEGATFIFDPSGRSNDDDDIDVIYNKATGEEIGAYWQKPIGYSNGWMKDSQGNCFLRMLGGYQGFNYYDSLQFNDFNIDDFFTLKVGEGRTIEFDYKFNNVLAAPDTTDTIGSPIGIMMGYFNTDDVPTTYPYIDTRATMFSGVAVTAYDVVTRGGDMAGNCSDFYEIARTNPEERTHTVFTINKIKLSNIEYLRVRIYINGSLVKVLTVDSNYYNYKSESGYTTVFGISPMFTDIDVYGIKLYDKVLNENEVLQEYIYTLPKNEQSVIIANNDILIDNKISYTKALLKYNTLLYTGDTEKYNSLNEGVKVGDLTVHIVNDPAHSGTFKNIQSLISSGYDHEKDIYIFSKYNDIKGDEYNAEFITEEGNTLSGYNISDELPNGEIFKIRTNVSGSASHAMGVSNAYNDLYNKVISEDGIKAAPQKPFLFFMRKTEQDTPEFYCAASFGPEERDPKSLDYSKYSAVVFPYREIITDEPQPLRLSYYWDDTMYISNDDWYDCHTLNSTHRKEFLCENTGDGFVIEKGETIEDLKPIADFFNFLKAHRVDVQVFDGTYSQLVAAAEKGGINGDWNINSMGMPIITTQTESVGGIVYNAYNIYYYANNTIYNDSVDNTPINVADLIGKTVTNKYEAQDWLIRYRIEDFNNHIGEYCDYKTLAFHMAYNWAIGNFYGMLEYITVDKETGKIGFLQSGNHEVLGGGIYVQQESEAKYYWEPIDVSASYSYYAKDGVNTVYNDSYNDLYPFGYALNPLMQIIFGTDYYDTSNQYRNTIKEITYEILNTMKEESGDVQSFFDKYFKTQFPEIAFSKQLETFVSDGDAEVIDSSFPPYSFGNYIKQDKFWTTNRIMYLSSYAEFGEFESFDPAYTLEVPSFYDNDGLTNTARLIGKSPFVFYHSIATKDISYRYHVRCKYDSVLYNYLEDIGDKLYEASLSRRTIEAWPTMSISIPHGKSYYIRGINYFTNIAVHEDKMDSFGNTLPALKADSLTINAKRLLNISNDSTESGAVNLTLNTPWLQWLFISGKYGWASDTDLTSNGILDASNCVRTYQIDIESAYFKTTILPEVSSMMTFVMNWPYLTYLNIPKESKQSLVAILEEINAKDSNSSDLENLKYVHIDKVPYVLNSAEDDGLMAPFTIVYKASNAKVIIDFVEVVNTDPGATLFIAYIIQAWMHERFTAYGKIETAQAISFDAKRTLIESYGNIDDVNNSLYIKYPQVDVTDVQILGPKYLWNHWSTANYTNEYKFYITGTGNKFKSFDVEWPNLGKGSSSSDPYTRLYVGKYDVGDEVNDPKTSTITAKITLLDNSVIEVTKEVCLYKRYKTAEIGDLVYADGTITDEQDYHTSTKSSLNYSLVVGIVFNKLEDGTPVCIDISSSSETNIGKYKYRLGPSDRDGNGYSGIDIADMEDAWKPDALIMVNSSDVSSQESEYMIFNTTTGEFEDNAVTNDATTYYSTSESFTTKYNTAFSAVKDAIITSTTNVDASAPTVINNGIVNTAALVAHSEYLTSNNIDNAPVLYNYNYNSRLTKSALDSYKTTANSQDSGLGNLYYDSPIMAYLNNYSVWRIKTPNTASSYTNSTYNRRYLPSLGELCRIAFYIQAAKNSTDDRINKFKKFYDYIPLYIRNIVSLGSEDGGFWSSTYVSPKASSIQQAYYVDNEGIEYADPADEHYVLGVFLVPDKRF